MPGARSATVIAANDPLCHGVAAARARCQRGTGRRSLSKSPRAIPVCRGFAIGRTIFGQPARDWFAGAIDDATAVARVARGLRAHDRRCGGVDARRRPRREGRMKTIRLTMAQALVRHLAAQRIRTAAGSDPLFHGVFAIFGHGNVAGIGEALAASDKTLPTFRAHNEQAMAHAAIAFAKANRRRRMMACTTSVGPGATNLVTAAALAHANRLPVLLLPGDTFAGRQPDPGTAAARGLRRPDCHGQRLPATGVAVLGSHHAARATARVAAAGDLGAARSGRLRAGDARAAAGRAGRGIRLPAKRSSPSACTTSSGRARIARGSTEALRRIKSSRRPLIVAGGGVHYSGAQPAARGVRRAPRHPGRGDAGRQGRARLGSRLQRRRPRRHRLERRERAACGIRPRARARHAPAGFHDRLGQAGSRLRRPPRRGQRRAP